ncbi:XRE family transcriptional regulator [Campylobacter ureolyticus]|uniref:Helix-turn-helix domain-containing protein n=1 Tax=Campylobacter ureolyticus TaxID=827 RepID=A0A9Q4KQH6_9BACT|nr:S24 family peptidase [Campylobacter ureolyticus]MCZ6135464.1 helix-turn-helix domain-containing protein [Campylobacter ureolyticus]MCZ6162420.1 helix-turn-helix domain-containing protein [Campylobacter ureolyticus]MCZ6171345.1 helix-turn-helix domain-containing protein [Campylobacter ureolyticus]
MKDFDINLKRIRDELGMTQSEISEKIGLSLRQYQRYEKKPANLTFLQISEFADKLNISVDELKSGNTTQPSDTFSIKKITSYFASAGGGNEINDIEVYDTNEVLQIDKAFFKLPPSKNARAIRVDGYSMIPVLLPDSWVIFEEENEFKGDGLYVINYSGQLMVKLLQLTPKGVLRVISKNEDFESYEIKLNESNEFFRIVGKVIKCIV